MKKMIFTLVTMLAMAVSAKAMSYEQARNEALFLTDKMAYELNLTDMQYEAAYEINLDYLMSVTGFNDVNGVCWERRNMDMSYILYSWQWELFRAASYFFRPLYWDNGLWHFGIYSRYPRRDYFYFGRPHFYASYRGGHSWHLNGGRSYYEGRRDFFRPGHVERSSHFGMRSGWDRGDYRNGHRHSSTRITGPERHNDNRGGHHNDNHGGYRNNLGGSGHFDGNRNGGFGGNRNNGGGHSDNHNNSGSHNSGGHGHNPGNSGSHSGGHGNSGNFNGGHSGSNGNSGSFSGGHGNSGSHSGGHGNSGNFSGNHSNGNSHSSNNFSGSRNGSSHSSGSFSGNRNSSSHSSGSVSGSRSSGGSSSGHFSGGNTRGGGGNTRGGDNNRGGSSRR